MKSYLILYLLLYHLKPPSVCFPQDVKCGTWMKRSHEWGILKNLGADSRLSVHFHKALFFSPTSTNCQEFSRSVGTYHTMNILKPLGIVSLDQCLQDKFLHMDWLDEYLSKPLKVYLPLKKWSTEGKWVQWQTMEGCICESGLSRMLCLEGGTLPQSSIIKTEDFPRRVKRKLCVILKAVQRWPFCVKASFTSRA